MKKILIVFLLLFDVLISRGQTDEFNLLSHINYINKFESKYDTLNNDYLISLNNLGKFYEKTNQFKLAEDIYLKTLKIRISKFGTLHLDVATSSIHLSDLYYKLGQYNKAIKFNLKAFEIRSKLLEENDLLYIKSLGKLAAIYLGLKNYNEAEKYLLKGLRLKQEFYKHDDQSIISSIENIIQLYNKQGKYTNSEEFYLILNQLYKKTKGENDFDYINSLSNLAVVYYYQEKYLDAENTYIISIELLKRNINNDSKFIRRYIESLSNLAELYRIQGKFAKSEKISEEALEINKLKLHDNVDMQIAIKHNLALLFKDIKKYKSSADYLSETLELIKKSYGRDNLRYASTIGNLGVILIYLGFNKKNILPLLESQLLIRKKILGINHPLYLQSLINLADYNRNLGILNKSREKYLEALLIVKNNYEENNQQFLNVLLKLGKVSRMSHKNEDAYNYLNEYLINNQFRLKEVATSYVENELIFYVKSNESSKDEILNFIDDFPTKYQNLNINSFNNLIVLKNLSLKNRELINISIQKNSTLLIKDKYLKFLANKKLIEKYIGLPIKDQSFEYENLKIETSKLEKELINESSKFSKIINTSSTSFKDLTKNLKNDEIIFDLNLFNYNKKKGVNQNIYASFIVKKDFEFPKFIRLFEEKELTQLLENNKSLLDSTWINKKYQEQAISDLFLNPMAEELNVY
ncbi:tetratricopeptide repeat protein [Aquirufa sp. OSTEICH-129A]